MKKHIIKYAIMVIVAIGLCGCSKSDEILFADPDIIDVSTIDSIALVPNHTMVVANGKAVLDLMVRAYTKDRIEIYNSRLNEEWFEYSSDQSGLKLGRYFSTSDKSLVGKTIKVKVNLKQQKTIASKEISFTVIQPIEVVKEYIIPVVFHIVQTAEDISSYGGIFERERITQVIDRLNSVFSGAISTNPTGVNTKITFKAALYNPVGRKLAEPGINRLVSKEITYDDPEKKIGYDDFLTKNNLVWSAKHYMNIWLISGRGITAFGFNNSYLSVPIFKFPSSTNAPEGLILTDVYDDASLSAVKASGVMYKLQSLALTSKSTGSTRAPGENDLAHYVGSYFGLLRTSWFIDTNDYCSDTQRYAYNDGTNDVLYKTLPGVYFMGENIMDDPTGVHRSITQDQYSRIQWVLENSPERVAWKSNFAFTGR